MESINEANLYHILDELTRIRVLISANVFYFREEQDEQQTEDEQSSAQLLGIPLWAMRKADQPGLEEGLARLRNEIEAAIENSPNTRANLRLLKLRQLFDLSQEEMDIFLICLIREFDASYQALWIQLQNNLDKEYPLVETVLNLLSFDLAKKLKLREYLQNGSKLFKYNLLECADTRSHSAGFTLGDVIKVSPRILSYLLGNDNVMPYLSPALKFLRPSQAIEDLYLPESLIGQIDAFASSKSQALFTSKDTSIISLRGKEGAGHQIVTEGICHRLGINMLIADIDSLLAHPSSEWLSILSSVQQEAILQNAAIYWQNVDSLTASDKSRELRSFVRQLSQFQGLHFLALGPNEYFPFHQSASTLIHLDIPNLTTSERFKLWQRFVPDLPSPDLAELAQSFQIGLGQIYDIATHLRGLFKVNDAKLSKEKIYEVCHTHAYKHLSRYAKLAKPIYKLENIVLPEECKQELEEIISWMRYKEAVYETGGFNKKVSLGKGLITMFFGQPGTGKTMAAEVIANTLDLLLYKIDLPSVLSKWVGETEQHLDKVFNEAENSNAILFFDEADSLFGRRGEVKDASDNYANIQTSYLLQKVEEYPGMVILSTNFKNNIDAAFVRRLHFSIEFPFPTSQQRRQIWQQIWPQDVILGEGVDLQKLADKVNIAGGNIKNIALAATFKAIAEQSTKEIPIKVTKDHLIFAIKREFRKMGHIIIHEQLNKIFNT